MTNDSSRSEMYILCIARILSAVGSCLKNNVSWALSRFSPYNVHLENDLT